MNENDPKVLKVRRQLATKGIFALYGGRKGHGFWLYRFGKQTAEALTDKFNAEHFWDQCDSLEITPVIKNDGKHSGNPFFWLFRDAVKLAEGA